MTKRVVLIGHPVAHSLSGAMQQAAFDYARASTRRYELWDRAPIDARRRDRRAPRRRLPRRERHDPAQGAGRPDGRPADRGGPRDRRGQHDHPRGQAAHRPQHGRARASRSPSTSSSGKQKMPRQAVVLGAGGGARAVVYGLITRGLPADRRVQPPPPPGRGPGQALRRAAPRTWSCGRCPGTSRSSRPSWPRPRSSSTRPRSG